MKDAKTVAAIRQLTVLFVKLKGIALGGEAVDQMQQTETDGVAPLAHPLELTQTLRADQVTETNHREKYQSAAPHAEAGLYLVPRVVE